METELNKFLSNEQESNANGNWNKLAKTTKLTKLYDYAYLYATENKLDDETCLKLRVFLKASLEGKKFQRAKDVNYDKNAGKIKEIPILVMDASTNRFTLRNLTGLAMNNLTPTNVVANSGKKTLKHKNALPSVAANNGVGNSVAANSVTANSVATSALSTNSSGTETA